MINSKYLTYYNKIISYRRDNKPEGYVEHHHINPRSLGGSDESDNIVALTAREHYVCHLLLMRIHSDNINEYMKMVKACMMMITNCSTTQQRYFTSRVYEYVRKEYSHIRSIEQSGSGNSQYNTKWCYNEQLRQCKKIPADQLLEDGWVYGRRMRFDYLDRLTIDEIKNKPDSYDMRSYIARCEKKRARKIQLNNIHKQYEQWYELYCSVGWEQFKRITNYPYSQPNLVSRFKKYVKTYTPQNGLKRGK